MNTRRRVLLVGAGQTGAIVAAEFKRQASHDVLVGFLDDDPDKTDIHVAGLPVLGLVRELGHIVATHQVDRVIITIPSATGALLRRITDACHAIGVDVKTMPGIVELLGQPVTTRQLRPVELGDLLRRAQVGCDAPPPGYLAGARVLITGAGGSIGSELARQAARAGPASIVLLGHGENSIHGIHADLVSRGTDVPLTPVIADIRTPEALARVFGEHRPTVVFHAAAHKHVPLMEAHAAEAVRNNVIGTRNVVDQALVHDVTQLVFISTDKAVAPTSVMGATKRIGEWIVHAAAEQDHRAFSTVRFGNVLGSRGSLVPVLDVQIRQGGPVTLTHPEMRRFFMTIPEAVHLVLQAGGRQRHGELVVLDMGPPVRIVDLTHDLIRLSGLEPDDVQIVYSGPRPGEKLVESLWEEGSTVERAGTHLFSVREPQPQPRSAELDTLVAGLRHLAARGDTAPIHRALADAIPTFASSLCRSDEQAGATRS